MGLLFIISVVALLALLWAAFSTARHIRRARRRQRNAMQAVTDLARQGNDSLVMKSPVSDRPASEQKAKTVEFEVAAPRAWREHSHSSAPVSADRVLRRNSEL